MSVAIDVVNPIESFSYLLYMATPVTHSHPSVLASPFRVDDSDNYQRWRDAKLEDYPSRAEDLIVEVRNPLALTAGERTEMLVRLRKTNMVIYACRGGDSSDKGVPRAIGTQFGLVHLDENLLADEDSISSLRVMPEKSGRGYIPYSNKRLLWHTDGYYNGPDKYVRAFVLHCVTPAAAGGENCLLDPEIAYIRLRDEEPEYIRAFMALDAMTIPANEESGAMRAAVSGPVFSIDPRSGSLHMRYTARSRSIRWRNDKATHAAVSRLAEILSETSHHHFCHRLESGQGLLCNNVLHNRSSFANDMDSGRVRLLYRARYHDRIDGTGLGEARE